MQRIEETLKLRLLGACFEDLRSWAQSVDEAQGKAPWGVSDRTLRRYIRASDKLLARQAEKDRERNMNHALARREALFAKAMSVNDFRTALAVERDRCELLRLYDNDFEGRISAIEERLKREGKL